jgi:hypothetical protein
MRETSVTVSDLIPVKSQKLRNVYFYLGRLASQAWVVKYISVTDLSVLKEFTESIMMWHCTFYLLNLNNFKPG